MLTVQTTNRVRRTRPGKRLKLSRDPRPRIKREQTAEQTQAADGDPADDDTAEVVGLAEALDAYETDNTAEVVGLAEAIEAYEPRRRRARRGLRRRPAG